MMAVEVAHTDGLYLALSNILLYHLPDILYAVLHRPVNQQQVDVVGLQFNQALIDRLPDCLTTITHHIRINLSGEEYFLSRHSAVNNALSNFSLIMINYINSWCKYSDISVIITIFANKIK